MKARKGRVSCHKDAKTVIVDNIKTGTSPVGEEARAVGHASSVKTFQNYDCSSGVLISSPSRACMSISPFQPLRYPQMAKWANVLPQLLSL